MIVNLLKENAIRSTRPPTDSNFLESEVHQYQIGFLNASNAVSLEYGTSLIKDHASILLVYM